jgi:hypothetical protein
MAGVGLAVLGKLVGGGLPVAVLLTLVYPLVLLPLGFYLPAERQRLRALRLRPRTPPADGRRPTP